MVRYSWSLCSGRVGHNEPYLNFDEVKQYISSLKFPYLRYDHDKRQRNESIYCKCTGHTECPHKLKVVIKNIDRTCDLYETGTHGNILQSSTRGIPHEVSNAVNKLLNDGVQPRNVKRRLLESKDSNDVPIFNPASVATIKPKQLQSSIPFKETS